MGLFCESWPLSKTPLKIVADQQFMKSSWPATSGPLVGKCASGGLISHFCFFSLSHELVLKSLQIRGGFAACNIWWSNTGSETSALNLCEMAMLNVEDLTWEMCWFISASKITHRKKTRGREGGWSTEADKNDSSIYLDGYEWDFNPPLLCWEQPRLAWKTCLSCGSRKRWQSSVKWLPPSYKKIPKNSASLQELL